MTMSCDDASSGRPAQRFEVFTGAGQRRDWGPLKAAIVAESYSGQESVSAVARRHGLRASQLFTWRRELRKELEAQIPYRPASALTLSSLRCVARRTAQSSGRCRVESGPQFLPPCMMVACTTILWDQTPSCPRCRGTGAHLRLEPLPTMPGMRNGLDIPRETRQSDEAVGLGWQRARPCEQGPAVGQFPLAAPGRDGDANVGRTGIGSVRGASVEPDPRSAGPMRMA